MTEAAHCDKCWTTRREAHAVAEHITTATPPSTPCLADDLAELRMELHLFGWSAQTSSSKLWDSNHSSRGQCAVTALVVQDRYGGDLLRVVVNDPELPGLSGSHYYNRLPDGRIVDLTRNQFSSWRPEGPPEVRPREYLLANESTAERYRLLVSNMGVLGCQRGELAAFVAATEEL